MLQPATQTTDVSIAEFGPTGFIRQPIPYAYRVRAGERPCPGHAHSTWQDRHRCRGRWQTRPACSS